MNFNPFYKDTTEKNQKCLEKNRKNVMVYQHRRPTLKESELMR